MLNGGCFFLKDSINLHIKNCSVFNSSAALDGGVCYLEKMGDVVIQSSTIDKAKASRSGGFVYMIDTDNIKFDTLIV